MQIIEAKLSDLKIDPANVRHMDVAPDQSLLASLRSKGVLVPLTVRKNGAGYFVTDGGKRLAALHILSRDGEFDKATLIPCVLGNHDEAAAADISLTTNFVREDMHPVDVYEAFATLKAGGKSAEDIANEYGQPLPIVRQFLALGQLSPKVREAWKEGKFADSRNNQNDVAQIAQLFTLAGSHEDQDKALEKLKKRKELHIVWRVKEAIVGNSNEGGKFVAFVGVEAYKAAGGKMREDLFGSDHIIDDLPIAKKLADDKLLDECTRMVELGWSWAEPFSDLPKGCEHSWQHAYQSIEQFPKGQREQWGLALFIDRDGKLGEHILQKPEQKKAADKAAKTKAAKKAGTDGPAPKEESEPKISQALNHKLSVNLTEAAAHAVQMQPDLAFCIGLAALLCDTGGFGGSGNVKLQCRGLGNSDDDDDGKEWEFDKALSHVQKLTPKARAGLFAMFVGQAFNFTSHTQNPLDPEISDAHFVCNAIDPKTMNAALLEKFDALEYFKGASGRLGLIAFTEMHGKGVSAPSKKAELAEACAADARLHGWLPPELRTKNYDGPGSKGWKQTAGKKTKPAKKKAR